MAGDTTYDVIVVGARCAGSPTAMLLAHRGYRVLLVDRHTFPSDSFRGHVIQSEGVARLARWGLLDRIIASGCPPLESATTDFDDFPLVEPVSDNPELPPIYAPRRFVLDAILVDAAAEAGAEVRQGYTVHHLLTEDGQVTGVRGRDRSGAETTERARIVVGADGLHSLVAREVNAPALLALPTLTFSYYSYFEDVPDVGLGVFFRGKLVIIVFPTNDLKLGVAVQAPIDGFHRFRDDIEHNFHDCLQRVPSLARRLTPGLRAERWLGSADLPNVLRKPHGPGWALVGDAGYHKDPLPAQGISDAFRDAELLVEAVDAGLSGGVPMKVAMADYEKRRNEVAIPSLERTCMRASFPPFPETVLAARRATRDAVAGARAT